MSAELGFCSSDKPNQSSDNLLKTDFEAEIKKEHDFEEFSFKSVRIRDVKLEEHRQTRNLHQNETPKQQKIRLAKMRERQKEMRMNEDERTRIQRLEKQKNYQRMKRLQENSSKSLSDRELRLEEQRIKARISRANESEEKRRIRQEKSRNYVRWKRENETDEERIKRLEATKIRNRIRRMNESREEKELRLKKMRERKRFETEEERNLRLSDLKMLEVILKNESDDPLKSSEPLDNKFSSTNSSYSFNCSQCPRSFEFRSSLIVHELEHRPKVKCKICSQNVFKHNLQEHKKLHQNSQVFTCVNCEKIFYDEISLKFHQKEHKRANFTSQQIIHEEIIHQRQDIKNFLFCDKCGEIFTQKIQLLDHLFRDHLNQELSSCLKCNFSTYCQNLMRIHKKTHEEHKIYCKICKLDFVAREQLQKHRVKVHQIFDHQCDKCGQRFGFLKTLKRHLMKFHESLNSHAEAPSDPRPFKCDLCRNNYTKRRFLEYHIRRDHLKLFKYKCTMCDFSSNNVKDLINHKVTHRKYYKCGYCDKSFQGQSGLRYHIEAVHEKSSNYSCSACERKFSTPNNLYKHFMSTHDTSDRFKCQLCSTIFITKNRLTIHQRKKHNLERSLDLT